MVPDKRTVGAEFKKDAKALTTALEALTEEQALDLKARMERDGAAEVQTEAGALQVTDKHVKIERVTVKKSGRTFIPSGERSGVACGRGLAAKRRYPTHAGTPLDPRAVVEPSFGVGRVLYSLFEHAYYTREGDGSDVRTVLRFSPIIAPVKCTVFPLVQKEALNQPATELCHRLRKAGLSSIVDTTGTSIGKRYARTDEIGVPFAVTVDFQTIEDGTVTVRERDSMAQIRVPMEELVPLLSALCSAQSTWDEAKAKYPAHVSGEN